MPSAYSLLDACISPSLESEVARNVMRHIFLLKSRHLSADMPYCCAETGQKLIIFMESKIVKSVDVLQILLANINSHVSVHSLMQISPLLTTVATYWNLGFKLFFYQLGVIRAAFVATLA